MFYEDIKTAMLAGKLKVGLYPRYSISHRDQISIEAPGLLGIKAKLLTKADRLALLNLVKQTAGNAARELTPATMRRWVDEGKVILFTGKAGSGKTTFLKATLPHALYLNGRSSDQSKPNWFWHQLVSYPDQPVIIDEPQAFNELVLAEILGVIRSERRSLIVVSQQEYGSHFEYLWHSITTTPVGFQNYPPTDPNFVWIKLQHSRDTTTATWVGEIVNPAFDDLGEYIPARD